MRWIKHDTDANQDAKLQNVMLDYGLEGYGLYWYCLELIAGKVDKENITFELEHDARIIARNTGSTVQKVEEMMKYFIKIELFDLNGTRITCLKMAKRLDQSMTSNPQMREIINNFKNHDGVMTESCKIRLDKIRLEEKEIAPKKKREIFISPSQESITSYFAEKGMPKTEADKFYFFYDSKNWFVGKNKMKKWESAAAGWIARSEPKESAQSGDFI